MKIRRLAPVAGVAVATMLLSACPSPPEDPSTVSSPQYTALSLPRGGVALPSLFVGGEEVLSGACFRESERVREVAAPASLERRVTEKREVSGSVRSLFREYLVKAGLEADVARTAVSEFRIEASGLRLREVDPARVRPDFTNPACTQRELGFFRDTGRDLVVTALKAEEVRIDISEEAGSRLGAKLDAALQEMDAELGLAFDRSSDASDATELEGQGLVFGVRRTTLVVHRCLVPDLTLRAERTRDLCGGLFRVRVEPLTPGRYRLLVTPRTGTTDESLQGFGRQSVRAVGELHAVWLHLGSGEPMTGRFEGILVGARGDGG